MSFPGSLSWGGFGGACCGGLSVVSLAILVLFGPAASERFALGCNFSEIFRPALGILPSSEPSGFRENELAGNGCVAIGAFHGSIVQHSILLRNSGKCINSWKFWQRLT